jgi:hypothetical protein
MVEHDTLAQLGCQLLGGVAPTVGYAEQLGGAEVDVMEVQLAWVIP